MATRTTVILVLLMIIGVTVAGFVLWDRLPEPMASHWGVNDQVDGSMPKFWGVALVPLITLAMFLLFLVIPAIDPLKANIAKFRQTFNLFIVLMMVVMLYIYSLTLIWNLGYTGFKMSTALLPALGLLLIFLGFMLRQAKRNFFIGIRTPWTLSSDTVWDKTHQLGSVLFMVSGGLAFIGGFFSGMIAFWFLFVPLIGSTIFLIIYSYVLYQQEAKA